MGSIAGCEEDLRAAQPPHGSCRRASSASTLLSAMVSVVTVGTCSAKSPYCQNPLQKQKHVSYKSNHSAAQEAENPTTSQSVIGKKNLVQSREERITPNNRRLPMDARKAVIGPLARFRRWRCPIPRRRTEAGLPVKVRLVRKSWCAPCGGW